MQSPDVGYYRTKNLPQKCLVCFYCLGRHSNCDCCKGEKRGIEAEPGWVGVCVCVRVCRKRFGWGKPLRLKIEVGTAAAILMTWNCLMASHSSLHLSFIIISLRSESSSQIYWRPSGLEVWLRREKTFTLLKVTFFSCWVSLPVVSQAELSFTMCVKPLGWSFSRQLHCVISLLEEKRARIIWIEPVNQISDTPESLWESVIRHVKDSKDFLCYDAFLYK